MRAAWSPTPAVAADRRRTAQWRCARYTHRDRGQGACRTEVGISAVFREPRKATRASSASGVRLLAKAGMCVPRVRIRMVSCSGVSRSQTAVRSRPRRLPYPRRSYATPHDPARERAKRSCEQSPRSHRSLLPHRRSRDGTELLNRVREYVHAHCFPLRLIHHPFPRTTRRDPSARALGRGPQDERWSPFSQRKAHLCRNTSRNIFRLPNGGRARRCSPSSFWNVP
jgi:hypothetical protein